MSDIDNIATAPPVNTPASSPPVSDHFFINEADPGHQHCLPYRLISGLLQRLGRWTRRSVVTPLLRVLNVPTFQDWDFLENSTYSYSHHLYDQLVVHDNAIRAIRRNQVHLQASVKTLQAATRRNKQWMEEFFHRLEEDGIVSVPIDDNPGVAGP